MKKKHLGSKFDDFLKSEGILEDCQASAIKTLAGIRRGLAQVKRGEGRPMREFIEELSKKHDISLE